jgi:hypothetical protein
MTAATADPVLVIPDGVAPPDRRFWVTPDMIPLDRFDLPVPRWNVIQTASFFFARSNSWLRALMRNDVFILDGKPLVFHRIQRGAEQGKGDPRYFSLADIEMMAYALAQQGSINENQFVCAVQIVKWVARNYQIIKD